MSATTTTTTTATSLSVLADYELHHSGDERSTSAPAPVNTSQPADWPTDHRRMPAYRPANRNLDYNERTAGTGAGEYVFIQVMLHGVWLNAAASRLWRFTGEELMIRSSTMRLEESGSQH